MPEVQDKTFLSEYHDYISKWISIYADLIGENSELKEKAQEISMLVPFNFARPHTVSAVCLHAAGIKLNKNIRIKSLIEAGELSMTSFKNIRNRLLKKGIL